MNYRIPCFFISSTTNSSSAYQSSPNLRISGSFRNLYTGRFSLLPQQYSGFADIPTMIVHCLIGSVVPHPYRIEMTGYGFVEVGPTLTVSLFDGTIATAFIIIAGKDAILVVDNRSHQVTFIIGIHAHLAPLSRRGLREKARPKSAEHLFQFLHLVQLYGSTGIALNATSPGRHPNHTRTSRARHRKKPTTSPICIIIVQSKKTRIIRIAQTPTLRASVESV